MIIGLIAGAGAGLVSLGGGTLVIPLLMGWMQLSPVSSRGTALVVSVFSATIGAWMYYRTGLVDLQVVLWVAIPSVLISPIAARLSENWSPVHLKMGFGMVVIMGGLLMFLHDQSGVTTTLSPQWKIPFLLFVGTLEGFVAGIVGVSGGPVLAPLFVLGLGMPQQLAQGCSLASRLPAIASGTWENWRLGNIQFDLVPWLAVGAMAGATFGSRIAFMLPEHSLRLFFASLLILLGGHYLLEGLKKTHR